MPDIFNILDTWNDAGVTWDGIKLNVTDTASHANSLLMDLQIGGVSKFKIAKDGSVTSTGAANFSGNVVAPNAIFTGGNVFLGALDTVIAREAANILALRNSTNAQTFNVYGTYTDASNYERLKITVAGLETQKLGTGADRGLYMWNATNGIVSFATNNVERWKFSATGHLIAHVDNTYDIGASADNRPRNIYLSGASSTMPRLTINSDFLIVPNSTGTGVAFFGGSMISGLGTDKITLLDNAQTSFGLLQFGGTSSSFPALKRSTSDLLVRLADDSGFAGLAASNLTLTGQVTTGGAGIQLFSTGTYIQAPADGRVIMKDSAGTDFNRLMFGGTTSSFPAIKRDGGNIQFVLADESNYTHILAGQGVFASHITSGGYFEVTEITAPAAPAANKLRVYAEDVSGTTKLRYKDSAGTVTTLSGGGGSGITVADTQVLFADGADNPAGDAGLVYNKTTDTLTMAAAGIVAFSGRSKISSSLDSRLLLQNAAGDAFQALQFGGTDANFPAIYRSGTALRIMLADGSAYTSFQCDWFSLESPATGIVFGSNGRLVSAADGQYRLRNNNNSANGILQSNQLIVAQATAATLVAIDSSTLYTNEGATAQVVLTLPTAVVGMTYSGYVQDADGLQFLAVGSDTIRIAGSVTGAAGNVASTTVGSAIKLTCTKANNWIAEFATGTWVLT